MLIKNFRKWFMAIRPISLWTSAVPILIGIAMAFGDGIHHVFSAVMALIGGLLIHIICNLTNDYGDFQKGADRLGDSDTMRQNPIGTISQKELFSAIIVTGVLAIFPCVYLVQRGGWPIAVIAISSLAAAVFYTIGKRPLGYRGLGDILVLVFMGPVASAGTYYVQTFEINAAVVLAGLGPGLLTLGVLTVNNIRDIESDRQAQKMTLVVRFGRKFGEWEYFFVVHTACLMPLLIFLITRDYKLSLAAVLTIYFAYSPIKAVFAKDDPASLNQAIGQTLQLLQIYLILFSLGWILS